MRRAGVLYRAALAAGLTLAATLGMSVVTAVPATAATTHHVTMTGFPTNPAFCVEGDCSNHTVIVSPGDTVVWTFSDGLCDLSAVCPGHTASSTSFDSGTMHGARLLGGGATSPFGVTFGSSGTYQYACKIHGSAATGGVMHMDGAVVVLGPASQSVLGSSPIVITNPGFGPAGSGSGNGSLPIGTSNSVSSDQLPNTFIPGLPVAGRAPVAPAWMLLALGAMLAGLPAVLLTTVGLAARRS